MKPFIDRDGRIFGLVSVVDLLVLIFLVLAGVSLYLKANVLDTTQTAQSHDLSAMDTVSVQVLVSNVSDFVADALEIGDEVYDQGNFDWAPFRTSRFRTPPILPSCPTACRRWSPGRRTTATSF